MRVFLLLLLLLFGGVASAGEKTIPGVFAKKEINFPIGGVDGQYTSGRSVSGEPFYWLPELSDDRVLLRILVQKPLSHRPDRFIVVLETRTETPIISGNYVLVGFQFPEYNLTEFVWVKLSSVVKMVDELNERISQDKRLPLSRKVAALNN